MGLARVRPWIGTLLRLVLGGVWVAAGAQKVGDLAASGRAVAAYRLLPYGAATVVGVVQPFVEIALGLLLILGLGTRVAAAVSTVLLLAFIGGIASAWARGLRIDCGCFSAGGDLTGDQPPQYTSETIRDIALLLAAGYLVVFPKTRVALDSRLSLDEQLGGGVGR